ncbi:MAG: mersacidin/lichenicidin family type 2 lantibiotic [Gemmataceae bacterium]|nr:mersacidin/lichenicidin family type 2 lantibiotic [Gemmataceae bacterium]
MRDDEILNERLLNWQELREQHQEVSAEELCRDRPDLLPELRRRILALERMDRALGRINQVSAILENAVPAPASGIQEDVAPAAEVRAWKDEDFRQSLSAAERDLLPEHPAGLIDLTAAELHALTGGYFDDTTTCYTLKE